MVIKNNILFYRRIRMLFVLCFFLSSGICSAMEGRDAAVNIHYERGVRFYKEHKYDKAIEELQRVLEISPENAQAKKYLTAAADNKNKEIIQGLYAKAKKYSQNRDYEKTIETYNEVLKISPKDEYASYRLRELEVMKGKGKITVKTGNRDSEIFKNLEEVEKRLKKRDEQYLDYKNSFDYNGMVDGSLSSDSSVENNNSGSIFIAKDNSKKSGDMPETHVVVSDDSQSQEKESQAQLKNEWFIEENKRLNKEIKSLQAANKEINKKLEDVEIKNQELEMKVLESQETTDNKSSKYQVEIERLKAKNESLEAEKEKLQEGFKESFKESKLQKSRSAASKGGRSDLRFDQIKELIVESQDSGAKIRKILEEELSTQYAKIDEMEEDISNLEADKKIVEKELDSANALKQEAEEELRKKLRELGDLKVQSEDRIKELEGKFVQQEMLLSGKEETLKTLKDENQVLKRDMGDLRSDLQEQILQSQGKQEGLSGSIKNLQTLKDDLEIKLSEAQKKSEDLTMHLQVLKESGLESDLKIQEAQGKLEAEAKLVIQQEEQLKTLEEENKKLRETIDSLTIEKQNALDESKAQLKMLDDSKSGLELKVKELEEKLAAQEGIVIQQQEKILSLGDENKKIVEEFNTVKLGQQDAQDKLKSGLQDAAIRFQDKLEGLKASSNKLTVENNSFKKQIEDNASKLEFLESQLKGNQELREKLETKIKETEASLNAQSVVITDKEGQIGELKEQKNKFEAEVRAAQLEKQEALDKLKIGLQDASVRFQDKIEGLKTENKKSAEENVVLKDQLKEAVVKTQAQEKQLLDTQKLKEKLEVQLRENQGKVQAQAKLVSQNECQIKTLENERQSLLAKLKLGLQEAAIEFQNKIEDLKNKSAILKTNNAAMAKELDENTARALDLEKQVKEREEVKAKAETELANQFAVISEQNEKIKSLEIENQNQEEKEAQLTVEKDQLEAKIKEYEAERANLEAELNNRSMAVSGWEEKFKLSEADALKQKDVEDILKEEKSQLEVKLKGINEQKSELEIALDDKSKELSSKDSNIKALEDEIQKYKDAQAQLEEEKGQIEVKLKESQENLRLHSAVVSEKENKLGVLDKERKEAEEKLKISKDVQEKAAQEATANRRKTVELENINKDLMRELKNSQEKQGELNSRISTLEKEKEKTEAKIKEMEAGFNTQDKIISRQEWQFKAFESEKIKIEGELKLAKVVEEQAQKELRAQLGAAEDTKTQYETKINQAVGALDKAQLLEAENKKLTQELRLSQAAQKEADEKIYTEVQNASMKLEDKIGILKNKNKQLQQEKDNLEESLKYLMLKNKDSEAKIEKVIQEELATQYAISRKQLEQIKLLEDKLKTTETEVKVAKQAQEQAEREKKLIKDKADEVTGQIDRERLNMHYNLAVVFDKHGMYEDAEREYLKALEIGPQDAAVHYNLGILYDDKLNKNKLAVQHYKKFLEIRIVDGQSETDDTQEVKKWMINAEQEERIGIQTK